MLREPDEIAAGVTVLRAAFAACGRDPSVLVVRVVPTSFVFASEGTKDFDATGAHVPVAAGATGVELFPRVYCRGPDGFELFVARLVGHRFHLELRVRGCVFAHGVLAAAGAIARLCARSGVGYSREDHPRGAQAWADSMARLRS